MIGHHLQISDLLSTTPVSVTDESGSSSPLFLTAFEEPGAIGKVGINDLPSCPLHVRGDGDYIIKAVTNKHTIHTSARIAVESPAKQGRAELGWFNNHLDDINGGYAVLQTGKYNSSPPLLIYSGGVGVNMPVNMRPLASLHTFGSGYVFIAESSQVAKNTDARIAICTGAKQGRVELDWFNDESDIRDGGFAKLQTGKSNNSPKLVIEAGSLSVEIFNGEINIRHSDSNAGVKAILRVNGKKVLTED